MNALQEANLYRQVPHVVRPTKKFSGSLLFYFLAFVAFIFLNQMNVRPVELADKGVDFQVVARLSIYAIFTFLSLVQIRALFPLVSRAGILLHAALLSWLAVSTIINGEYIAYGLYALSTHFCVALIAILMIRAFGQETILHWYFSSVFWFCLVGIGFYLAEPDIGRLSYWSNSGLAVSWRMQGIAGHPNTLGVMCGSAILALIHIKARFRTNARFWIPKLFLISICLVLTNSKTSMGATTFCAFFYWCLSRRIGTFGLAVCGALGLGIFLLAQTSAGFVELFTRSNDAEEVLTLTGRTAIWSFLSDRIAERPFAGWGHATSTFFLSENSSTVGFQVGQAHDLYLQLLFSGGIIGLTLFVIGAASTVACAIRSKNRFVVVMMVFFGVIGITEAVFLGTIANNAYFLLVSVITFAVIEPAATASRVMIRRDPGSAPLAEGAYR